MPALSIEDRAKLTAIEAMLSAGEKIRFTEFVSVFWPAPDTTKHYGHTAIDETEGFEAVPFTPILPKLITSSGQPYSDVPKTSAPSDDKAEYHFNDADHEISRLCYLHGAGVRAEIWQFFPDQDLLLRFFTGRLETPKEANGRTLKLSITSGFRSAKLIIPRRLPTPGCMFIFGGHLPSLEQVNLHKGCPYNVHVGGSIGVPGLTDCSRDSVQTCLAHLGTTKYFPGFKTVVEGIANNQTKGPNLLAIARGNEGALTEPIRALYGEKRLKALRVLAYRPELDTNHPDKGWLAALLEIGEGVMHQLWDFWMSAGSYNAPVGFQHLNLRYGQLGQPQTAFSPNIDTYSGTAVAFGRIQGDFRTASASNISGSVMAQGFADIRVYSDETTYVETYTTKPIWCILDMHTRKRSMFGEDYERYDIGSAIECAAWHDEVIEFTDPNGNVFSGTRSTFNAELTGRAIQQQIEDACTAMRIGIPYEHNGKKVFTPLKKETIDETIPYFTDYGEGVNVCADSDGQAMISYSYTGDDELVNQYTVTFDDASNNWTSTTLIFGDQLQQLKAGKAYGDTSIRVINKDIPAFGITNMREAARLGNLLLYLGPRDTGGIANNFSVTFTTWFSQALEVRLYKLVKLNFRALQQLFDLLEIPGFEYFRVMKFKRKGNLQVELTVQAYPVDFYEAMETTIPIPPQTVGTNPGGGPGGVPCSVAFRSVSHTNDKILFALDEC